MITFRSNGDIAIVVTDISEAEWYRGGVFGFKIKKKA